MEKRGEDETSEQTEITDCAKESPKGETGERKKIRAKRAKKEVAVITWNVRTLAVKRKNGMGYGGTLLLRAQKSRCYIIGS